MDEEVLEQETESEHTLDEIYELVQEILEKITKNL